MVRVEVLRKRLNKLDEYLRILTRLQRYSFEEFMADPERYGSVERFQFHQKSVKGAHVRARPRFSDIFEIAFGSLRELHYQLGLSKRPGHSDEHEISNRESKIAEAEKVLGALFRSMRG